MIQPGISNALRAGLLLSAVVCSATAFATPWLEAGDARLRADVELLAAQGLIEDLTGTWPIGAAQLTPLRDEARLAVQPQYLRLAARRVLAAIDSRPRAQLQLRLADDPAVIRGFEAGARNQADAQLSARGSAGIWDAKLAAGVQGPVGNDDGRGARFAPDGSMVSATLGNWRLYGGWVDTWYGPGEISALSLSTNARPFPKLGLMREAPLPFESPWLSWMGPWRLDLMGGVLDGERQDRDTAFGSLRFTFSPIEHLEIGLARTTEFCGRNHPCNPLKAAFGLNNSTDSTNITNDEALIDLRYSLALGSTVIRPYLQHMNDDTGPFKHSYSSHLFGVTADGPWRQNGSRWRLLAEFTDSRATLNAFDFSHRIVGTAYNNGGYPDGMRYRGRTLGFSLDSDSKLLSVGGRYIGAGGLQLSLTLHAAQISSEALAAIQAGNPQYGNVVSATPVSFNELDAGLAMPLLPSCLKDAELALQLRARDHSLRPVGVGRYDGELLLKLPF